MENVLKCRKLIAVYEYEQSILGGPKDVHFDIKYDQSFHVNINQLVIRSIEISTDSDVNVQDLTNTLSKIERLLMLFDGRFIKLKELKLSESEGCSKEALLSYAEGYLKNRLDYYNSTDYARMDIYKLIDFESVLTAELYDKWDKLLEDMGTVHQMYLYMVSDNYITIDVKCAFLIELVEPIVEVIKEKTYYFSSLCPGSQGTTLKNCLDALITTYGEDIFKKELSSKFGACLQIFVNSRVNIMHIKRNHRTPTLNGEQSSLYAQKFSLLYRRIVFELLDIDYSLYVENIKRCVSSLDEWESILDEFLILLSKYNKA